jgi:hypothetical protein
MSFLALLRLSGTAFAQDVFSPTEPPVADSGWTVRYNQLLVACYQGNMDACDRVVSDPGMISDTPIYNWAATCGGRLDRVTARRLSVQMLQNGIRGGSAPTTYVLPISHAIAAGRTGCDEGHRIRL